MNLNHENDRIRLMIKYISAFDRKGKAVDPNLEIINIIYYLYQFLEEEICYKSEEKKSLKENRRRNVKELYYGSHKFLPFPFFLHWNHEVKTPTIPQRLTIDLGSFLFYVWFKVWKAIIRGKKRLDKKEKMNYRWEEFLKTIIMTEILWD